MKKVTIIILLAMTAIQAYAQGKSKERPISSEFPFESKYLEVLNSKIHYVDEGDKDAEHTFLLLHGQPTSNYLYRNIIPHLTEKGRVVAPDLIGMGKSGKPDIDYTYEQHIQYINEFIAKMDLDNIILVIHDWGSGIGFNYAFTHQDKVAGIVFMEAIIRPVNWEEFNFIEKYLFKRFRHPEKGYKMIVKKNFFIKKFLPLMTKRKLTKEEKAYYAAPYQSEADLKPVRVWPTQIAIGTEPKFSYETIAAYSKWLPVSDIPKLMFHAKPGMIIKPKEAAKMKKEWKALDVIFLGKGKHYLQETYPHEIGEGIVNWFDEKFK